MIIDKNSFDNYKVGAFYMFNGNIAKVVGHSECRSIRNAKRNGKKIKTECIGCKGRSHFKFKNGEIHKTCAHNGDNPLVRMHKHLPNTNTRW
ncbi:hypothetical protein GQ473_04235 [archaeon]|nr:hypothetical protein [archaeon]